MRLTYTLELKTKAYRNFTHLNSTMWAQAAIAPHWYQYPNPAASINCCDLQPGAQYVDYNKDCHPYNVTATNFTAKLPLVQLPAAPRKPAAQARRKPPAQARRLRPER